jgi:hypothetical protein
MNLKIFIENGKIDWSDAYFKPDTGTAFYSPYSIKPEDFITFAKADFFKADARGLVNALSNAKRAIDCQADSFIAAIGLDPQALDKQLGTKGLASLSLCVPKADGPLKFRFLQSLGVATPSIVGRMRRFRNLLEHEYKKPRKTDVSDAIGVAELFVQACKGKMSSPMEGFSFGSGKTKARGREQVAKEFYISFQVKESPRFEVRFWDQEWISRNSAGKSPVIEVCHKDDGFVTLLKLMWHADWNKDMTEALRSFLTELGIKLPLSRFRVRYGYFD